MILSGYHSSWRANNIKSLEDNAFGADGAKVGEAREQKTLVFILRYDHHFTLLVGYMDERQWEFYNSIKTDRNSLDVCKKFVSFKFLKFPQIG